MNLPNQLTIGRIVCIPIFVALFYLEASLGIVVLGERPIYVSHVLATIIFIIASITDWLDGYLARKYQLVTVFGKFADPLADKLLVLSAFIMLLSQEKIPAWVIVVIICREVTVTGFRTVLVNSGEVLAAAWPGKIKTATQMLAIIFLMLNDWPFHLPVGQVMLYLCLIFTIYSGVDYFYKNRHIFKQTN